MKAAWLVNCALCIVHRALVLCIVFLSLFLCPAFAQKPRTSNLKPQTNQAVLTRIEFVFDASASMYGRWQTGTKIEIAKKLFKQTLDEIKLNN